jgi:hypothetical protein
LDDPLADIEGLTMSEKGADFPVADIENLRRGTADLKQVVAELNRLPPRRNASPKVGHARTVDQEVPKDSDGEDTREDGGSCFDLPFTLRRWE